MLNGVSSNSQNQAAIAATDPAGSGAGMVGDSGSGFLLNNKKDTKDATTDPQFGAIWKDMQAKYGAKAEKPREIKKQLGKDDFLRIMITQMKHQDPTKPFEAEQFAAQLAQFASVEQLQNINNNITKMTQANQPLERMAMTNMIGKTVTVDRDRFPFTEGEKASLNYTLPKDAASVIVRVQNEAGETVFEKDIGEQKAGDGLFVWDGKKTNTLPAKTGSYMLRVEAKDENGQSLSTENRAQARVVGVGFENGETILLVGNPARPDKVNFKNVTKIEEAAPAELLPGAKSLAGAAGAASGASGQSAGGVPNGNGKQFDFLPGGPNGKGQPVTMPIGSQKPPMPSAANSMPAAAAAPKQQDLNAAAAKMIQQFEEKGFPNGLSPESSSAGPNLSNAKPGPAKAASGASDKKGYSEDVPLNPGLGDNRGAAAAPTTDVKKSQLIGKALSQ
ncbi:MAG: flagellar hook assembly protein FlgD [Bdellovibrionales bacterium]|nr:flagellar hook assembly protein FlgD [Bdellovibrionales bacterium]